MNNLKYFLLLTVVPLLFSSCDKDDRSPDGMADVILTTDTEESIAYIETLTNAIEEDIDDAVVHIESNSRSVSDCPTRTWENERGVFPNTLTIDYGENCSGKHGRTRSGKLIVEISDSLRKTGSTRTVSFENFAIDSVTFEGGKTWENLGIDEIANTITVQRTADLTLSFPDGTTREWSHDHNVTRSVFLVRDRPNVPKRIRQFKSTLEVTGSSMGTNRDGQTFESVITQPLYKPEDCFWFSSGMREVTRNGATTVFNYGDGDCDRKAEVTLPDGTVKEIRIRPLHLK